MLFKKMLSSARTLRDDYASTFLVRTSGVSQLAAVRERQAELTPLTDAELKSQCRTLQYRARSGQGTNTLLPEAFALISESIRRTYSWTLYDVQLVGATHLCQRTIVEMATGEGKTLTALLPLFLRGLDGKGMLLATSNDYLATRDADFARPVFELLGMTVGAVDESSSDPARRAAYACDITYGTAVQFGFDFLRDRAKRRFNQKFRPANEQQPVTRGRLHAVLIDEADSVLIDEASTPLLIAGAAPEMTVEKQDTFRWAAALAGECREELHYRYKKIEKQSSLTAMGKRWVHQQLPHQKDSRLSLIDYYEFVERAINVQRDLFRDRNYIIDGEELMLVDEGTGRIGRGRQWSEGIQQAVQAKEGIPITMPSGNLAKIMAQSFFLAFEHISGMTGTAKQAKTEFRRHYRLKIREIPTRLPNLRKELTATVHIDYEPWLEAITEECRTMQIQGRAVLIGARDVSKSELISGHLLKNGIPNQLLNARLDEIEAEIVSQAGQPGRITVATNMAGRGTDIDLHASVRESGGLHVILAGINTNRRIDRQLIGRAGRQGDPGSFRKMICLEDDLLDEAFQAEQARSHRASLRSAFSVPTALVLFERAQKTITHRNRLGREKMFLDEKKKLPDLHHAGLDPLLDIPS